MSFEKEIRVMETEWSPENGFFWRLRQGQFTSEEFTRALAKLRGLSIETDAELPRRLVSLLWFIPQFMQWQTERVKKAGGDAAEYERAVALARNEIERLLGVP